MVARGAALVVSLALQVGTNYANDYSDGVRGTDTVRVGPVRLVASGLGARGVKRAALVAFGVAALAGSPSPRSWGGSCSSSGPRPSPPVGATRAVAPVRLLRVR